MMTNLVNLNSDEKIIYFLRRHPIIFIIELVLITFLLAVPVGLYFILSATWPLLLTGVVSRPLLILLAGTHYLFVWLFFMLNFVDFYLDAWIVTNDRILNVEQHSLFSRTVSELDLANVQDVTSEVHGVMAFMFKFGNVHIQTASEESKFEFEQVRHPEEIRKSLLAIVDADRRKQEYEYNSPPPPTEGL